MTEQPQPSMEERQAPTAEAATTERGPLTVVGETWIGAGEAAVLLGITRQAVHWRCRPGGDIEHRHTTGDRGGRRLEVRLESLPGAAQARYRQAEGVRGEARDPQTGLTAAERLENAREQDRVIMGERLALLDAWHAYERLPEHAGQMREAVMGRFVATWHEGHPGTRLSASTLYRFERRRADLGAAGLLPEYALGERGQDVPKAIGDLVGRYYLDRNQRKLTVCYALAQIETARLHPELVDRFPCLATLRRYVRARWPRQAIILAREGDAAFRRRAMPSVETDFASYEVMELWVSDHAQMDLVCVGLEGKPIRPWATDWREFRSRKRVGWLVHEGPSADTILAAFAMAARRHGIPREVKFDNGRDYSGRTFAGASRRWRVNLDEPRVRALLEHLQCTVHFSLPGQPQGKASQERHYGVDREWFDKQWDSYCGRDPASRPEHLRYLRKRPDRLPSLAEVQHLYGLYCEWRNAQPHSGQGMDGQSPDAVFAAGEYVQRVVEARELRVLLQRPSHPRTVGRDGVWIFDRYYWSETIAHRLGERVYVRYDLDRIGEVHAFSLDDQYIDTLARVDLLAAGATAADARKAHARKAFVRRIGAQAKSLQQEVAARPDLVLAITGDRTAAAAIPPASPLPTRKAVEPVRTPFRAAAKAIEARATDRKRLAVVQREADADAAELVQPLGTRRKKSAAELEAEAWAELTAAG